MTEDIIEPQRDRLLSKLRMLGWGIVALIMIAPAFAMSVGAQGVDWTAGDFIAAAILLGGSGLIVELLVRLSTDWNYRIGAVLIVFATLFMVWSNLAVGIVGSEDNVFNSYYFLLLPLLAIGALLVRLKPKGMAALARIAALFFVGMLIAAFVSRPSGIQVVPFVIIIHAIFVTLYFCAGLLFSRAAQTLAAD